MEEYSEEKLKIALNHTLARNVSQAEKQLTSKVNIDGEVELHIGLPD